MILDWRALLMVMAVFGFLPGVVLRILVLAYPKGHPRRSELLAELYAQPYGARPLFVAHQLETAIADGVPARWRAWRATGYPIPLVRRLRAWRRSHLATIDEVIAEQLEQDEVLVHIDGSSFRSFVLGNPLLMVLTIAGAFATAPPLTSSEPSASGRLLVLGFAITISVVSVRRMQHQAIHYAVTNQRLLRISGVISRDVVSVPWSELHVLDYRRTLAGVVVGYAELFVETRSGSTLMFSDMNDPAAFVRRVLEVVTHKVSNLGDYTPSVTRGEWKNLATRWRERRSELVLWWPPSVTGQGPA